MNQLIVERCEEVARMLDTVALKGLVDLTEPRCKLQDLIDDLKEPENFGLRVFNPYPFPPPQRNDYGVVFSSEE